MHERAQGRTRAVERPTQVDRECPLPVRILGPQGQCVDRQARVVHQDVDAAFARDDLLERPVDRLWVGHVEAHEQARAPHRRRSFCCRLLVVEVGHHHPGAVPRQRHRDRATDPP